jgi:hypothetical protein
MSAPRIYCIPATRAPVAAVLARGPSDWVRLGRWDVEHDEYEHGAWLAGTVFRSDATSRRTADGSVLRAEALIDLGRRVDVHRRVPPAVVRMLVATTDGRLQVRGAEGPDSAVSWEVDLSADEPDPQPPPDQARRW